MVRNGLMPDSMVFKEMVNKLELVDSPLLGGQWTWTHMRNQPVCSQIDKFLVSPAFLLQYPGIYRKTLQRPISDHFPICLHMDGIQWDQFLSDWIIGRWKIRNLGILLKKNGKRTWSKVLQVLNWQGN